MDPSSKMVTSYMHAAINHMRIFVTMYIAINHMRIIFVNKYYILQPCYANITHSIVGSPRVCRKKLMPKQVSQV